MKLGINIDHIAYLREVRKINDPDPLQAVFLAKDAGASQITIHLREDRRHINDFDAKRIIEASFIPINLECSKNMIDIAIKLKPQRVTLVPENREEITTEGGLKLDDELKYIIEKLNKNNIHTSLFIDSNFDNIDMCRKLGVKKIELHTGKYANIFLMLNSNLSYTPNAISSLQIPRFELEILLNNEINNLKNVASYANEFEINVYAGHGLNYSNVSEIVKIKEIEELNIGQSIIARSIFTGLYSAIRDMLKLIDS